MVLPSASQNALEPLFVGQCSGNRARSTTRGMASIPMERSRKVDRGLGWGKRKALWSALNELLWPWFRSFAWVL